MARRQNCLKRECAHPDPMLHPGTRASYEPRHEPSGNKDHWDLPQRVQEVSKHPRLKSGHLPPPSSSSFLLSLAIFPASICRLLMRLITSSSLDPPNIRSTRSRTA